LEKPVVSEQVVSEKVVSEKEQQAVCAEGPAVQDGVAAA
jgi:hypothetical protein